MRCRHFCIAALLICGIASAQPATTYDYAQPSTISSVTNFSFIVDLSTLSAAWWLAAENVDATRGRVYSYDGLTQYAADWIDYSDAGETGFVRFQITGAVTDPDVRIYPPVSGNATVAASDTYGSNNAYDAYWYSYWPDGATTDRTSNAKTLTAVGSPSEGGTTGKVGTATNYSGSQYCYITSYGLGSTSVITVMAWWTTTTTATRVATGAGTASTDYCWIGTLTSAGKTRFDVDASAATEATATANDGSWHHVVGVQDSATSRTLFVDNTSRATDTSSKSPNITSWAIAALYSSGSYNWIGNVDEAQVHTTNRSTDWITAEYNQTNDNATFWGTWTNVPVGGGGGFLIVERLFVSCAK